MDKREIENIIDRINKETKFKDVTLERITTYDNNRRNWQWLCFILYI